MTKKHIHGELMMLYAKDAMETDKPWENWEIFEEPEGYWNNLVTHPKWVPEYLYRQKPKTINITAREEININDLRSCLYLSIEVQGIYPTMDDISLAIRRFETSISDDDPLKKCDIEWVGNVFDAFMCAFDLYYSNITISGREEALRRAIVNLQSLLRG